jgi:hypothetical protein
LAGTVFAVGSLDLLQDNKQTVKAVKTTTETLRITVTPFVDSQRILAQFTG